MCDEVLRCQLEQRRRAAGLGLAELAARVGLSRQALSAIEAGRATPSTAVALRLSRALDCQVEDLFALPDAPLSAVMAGDPQSRRVVLGHVNGRWVAHGLGPGSVESADGVVDESGAVQTLERAEVLARKALIAGCAPVLGALAAQINQSQDARATWLNSSSGVALEWLASGLVHAAGLHLADRCSPGTHDALVREAMPGVPTLIVSLVGWREGLLLAPGNPLGIRGAQDLDRPGLRIARRLAPRGAPPVLAQALERVGLTHVQPTGALVNSHLEAAQAVRFGAVDVAVGIEPMAEAFGLSFVPLAEERFELVLRTEHLNHPGVSRLLDQLSSRRFVREVRSMGAYDTDDLGRSRRLEAL